VHLEPHVFAKQLRDIALRIFYVSEMQRFCYAGVCTCRARLWIYTRLEPFSRSFIYAIAAERALLSNTETALIEPLFFLWGRSFSISKCGLVYLVSRLIGAGHSAVGATYAQLIVDCDNSVCALIRCTARTHLKAGRVRAMHTPDGHKEAADVRKFPCFDIQYLAPLHPRRSSIGMLACCCASLATDAQPQVSYHGIARHSHLPLHVHSPKTTNAFIRIPYCSQSKPHRAHMPLTITFSALLENLRRLTVRQHPKNALFVLKAQTLMSSGAILLIKTLALSG